MGGDGNVVCTAHEDMRDQLRDHEKRIVALEKSRTLNLQSRMENLIEKIDNPKQAG